MRIDDASPGWSSVLNVTRRTIKIIPIDENETIKFLRREEQFNSDLFNL